MSMRLFEVKLRKAKDAALYAETTFAYLDRSARRIMTVQRELLVQHSPPPVATALPWHHRWIDDTTSGRSDPLARGIRRPGSALAW